jgi:hypothetical protein
MPHAVLAIEPLPPVTRFPSPPDTLDLITPPETARDHARLRFPGSAADGRAATAERRTGEGPNQCAITSLLACSCAPGPAALDAVLVGVLVALTLVPAMLGLFPNAVLSARYARASCTGSSAPAAGAPAGPG